MSFIDMTPEQWMQLLLGVTIFLGTFYYLTRS